MFFFDRIQIQVTWLLSHIHPLEFLQQAQTTNQDSFLVKEAH